MYMQPRNRCYCWALLKAVQHTNVSGVLAGGPKLVAACSASFSELSMHDGFSMSPCTCLHASLFPALCVQKARFVEAWVTGRG